MPYSYGVEYLLDWWGVETLELRQDSIPRFFYVRILNHENDKYI